MTSKFESSPAPLVTFSSLSLLSPETKESGAALSSRDWLIDTTQTATIRERPGEVILNEYDALDEVKEFLDIAHATYAANGLEHRTDEVERFADQIAYLDSNAFDHATQTIARKWATQLDSGVRIAALKPSAQDTKDQGVASAEYILAHVLDHVRYACGAAAVKSIVLLDSGPDMSSLSRDSDVVEYVDDWTITGNQLRRNIDSYPEDIKEKLEVQLLVKRGLERTLKLDDGTSIPISGVYELPQYDDVHAGPSVIGVHGSVNYGWQNRLIEFGLDIATNRPTGQVVLPVMTHIERPYRTRRDTPSFFKRAGSFYTTSD